MRNVLALKDAFAGEDVFVVGTGTSLSDFDWRRLAGLRTIGLNAAGLHFHPSVWLFSDHLLWQRFQHARIPEDADTSVACCEDAAQQLDDSAACGWKRRLLCFRKQHDHRRASRDDPELCVARTVATAGVHLAWIAGAGRVLLLGIDGYGLAQSYYCDGSRSRHRGKVVSRRGDVVVEDRHVEWAQEMAALRARFDELGAYPGPWPGPGVYNLSPRSAIGAWEKVDPKEVLK